MGVSNLIEDCCLSGLVFETDHQPLRLCAIRAEPELLLKIKEARKVDQNVLDSIAMVKAGHRSEYQVRDNVLYVNSRIVVPNVSELRQRILSEAHNNHFCKARRFSYHNQMDLLIIKMIVDGFYWTRKERKMYNKDVKNNQKK